MTTYILYIPAEHIAVYLVDADGAQLLAGSPCAVVARRGGGALAVVNVACEDALRRLSRTAHRPLDVPPPRPAVRRLLRKALRRVPGADPSTGAIDVDGDLAPLLTALRHGLVPLKAQVAEAAPPTGRGKARERRPAGSPRTP